MVNRGNITNDERIEMSKIRNSGIPRWQQIHKIQDLGICPYCEGNGEASELDCGIPIRVPCPGCQGKGRIND